MPPKKLALTLSVTAEVSGGGAASGSLTAAAGDVSAGLGADRFEGDGVVVDGKGVHLGDSESMAGAVSFDDIQVIKKLGAGASSVVQLVRDSKGQLFALKQINLYDKNIRGMLLAELKSLFHSDCECLIEFYGAIYREGMVNVILEFMNAGGLDNVLRKAPGKKIPEHVLAGMAYQMIWGLGYLAHERRVHRDIKPQNVLVSTTGRVKLTDFGISRELSTAVMAKTFIGTMKYMSPERMQSQPYGFASDIWSLGLVLMECVTGKYPLPESSTQMAMVLTIAEAEVPLPPKDGTFTDEFVDFYASCVKRDPDERATAVDLLESDWFVKHGATSVEDAVEIVRVWMEEVGFKDDYAELRVPGAHGSAAGAAAASSK